MTYQNTNNVDCLCACMLHVYEYLCCIKYTKYRNITYIHTYMYMYMYTYIYTCTCIEYRSMHASNLEINNMRRINAKNL